MQTYSFEAILDDTFGQRGTLAREEMERAVEAEVKAQEVGKAIRSVREERNLTQQQLGALAGVQGIQVSRIEHGQDITLDSLTRILEVLGGSLTLRLGGLGELAL